MSRRIRKRHKLIRQYDTLSEKLTKKPLIKLDEPIFRGYIRYHVIREDILKSPIGKYVEIILPYVSRQEFSRRKDFTEKINKKREVRPHKLNKLNKKEVDELKEKLPERFYKHFYIDPEYQRSYIFYPNWWFETKVSRSYITHISEPLSDVESDLKKLSDKMDQDHIWGKVYGNGRSDDYWRPSPKRKRDLGKDIKIDELLDD